MNGDDLFARRQAQARGERRELRFVGLDPTLRRRVVLIWRQALGECHYNNYVWEVYNHAVCTLRTRLGLFSLGTTRPYEIRLGGGYDPDDELTAFMVCPREGEDLLSLAWTEWFLTAVEIVFRDISLLHGRVPGIDVVAAANELNRAFSEAGLGYRYEPTVGQIVRVDSDFLHVEVVAPVLHLLRGRGWEGAEEEFRIACEHLRAGRVRECLVSATSALESTLKIICENRGWHPTQGDFPRRRAVPTLDRLSLQDLIEHVARRGLFARHGLGDHQVHAVRNLLTAAGHLRNRRGAHGQGVRPVELSPTVAAYAHHQVAAAIVFLVATHEELPMGEEAP